ncbi:putative alpha/Beta hydrolase [Helianthus anomalus]
MKVAYKLKQGQSRLFHQLPSGLNMEVIYQKGVQTKTKTLDEKQQQQQPPLVFVHGSFHAAWCWSEHWLPFFSENGFDSYALSLLAQVSFILHFVLSLFNKLSFWASSRGRLRSTQFELLATQSFLATDDQLPLTS